MTNYIFMTNNTNLYFFSGMMHMSEELVPWQKPPKGWQKVNTNGAYHAATNLACCGGLIRDEDGVYLRSFSRKIGKYYVLQAELWGALDGLQLA